MQAWIAGFGEANPDVTVSYDAVGSGGGREQFVAGGTAFGGTDSHLKEEELTGAQERCGGPDNLIEIPAYISPIAVIYNLEGVDTLQPLARRRWRRSSSRRSRPGTTRRSRPTTRTPRSRATASPSSTALTSRARPRTSRSTWPPSPRDVVGLRGQRRVARQGRRGRFGHLRRRRRRQGRQGRDRLRRRLPGRRARQGFDQGRRGVRRPDPRGGRQDRRGLRGDRRPGRARVHVRPQPRPRPRPARTRSSSSPT